MDDRQILDLFWARSQDAIPAAAAKYGAYCRSIALSILRQPQDAEECVNDAWLRAWNAIPPRRPEVLSAFLGKLTRNLALNRWRDGAAEKRGGGETALALEELGDCLTGGDATLQAVEARLLAERINAFLRDLPREKRQIFLRRYWYLLPVKEIARLHGRSEQAVASLLLRLRRQLRTFLEQEELS